MPRHCLRIRLQLPKQLQEAFCFHRLRLVPRYKVGKSPRNLLNSMQSISPRRLARPRTSPFHGGNTGSNPVGDANHSKGVGVFYGLSILPYRTMGTRWKTQSYRGYTYAIPTTGQSRRECPSSLNRGVKDCHKPSLIVWGSTAK